VTVDGSVVSITEASGSVTVSATGFDASFSGSPHVNVSGFELNGQSLSLHVQSSGGQNTFEIKGTGISVKLAGVSISGSFAFSKGVSETLLTVDHLNAYFGGDGATADGSVVSLTEAHGSVSVTADGFDASFSGTPRVNVQGFDLGAESLSLHVNTSGGLSTIEIKGTGITIGLAGVSIKGDFAFSKSQDAVSLTVDHLNVYFGGDGQTVAGSVVSITEGSGSVTVDSTGFDATFSGSPHVNVSGFDLNGESLGIHVKTGGGQSLFEIKGTGISIKLAGVAISGDFSFTKSQ
jgi:hypothetical protein